MELLARIAAGRRREGLPVKNAFFECPLAVWTDVDGSNLKMKDGLQALADLLRIRRRYRPALAPRLGRR